MTTALSAFTGLPSTKAEVETFSNLLKEEIESGMVNPLELKIFFTCLSKVMENVKPTLDELAREAAEQYGEKRFKVLGATIELREVGTKYDYSNCNHPTYNRVKAEWEEKGKVVKELEKTLQTLKSIMVITDLETGETTEVFPPVKSSTSSIAVTL